MGVAALAGHRITHVKAHGSLGNRATEDAAAADAIARATKSVDPNLAILAIAGTEIERAAERCNMKAVREIFADRAYTTAGNLVSRRKPGAVLHDAKAIAQRVVRMVQDGAVVSVTGKMIKMRTDTVCIHGDTPGAVDIARGVRQALKDGGIEVAPFKVANG